MINQIGLLILAIVGGFMIALFYDLYWLKIAYQRRQLFKAIVQDLIFWLIMLSVFAGLWFYLTSGIMRLAIYFWLILGIIAQRLILAPYFAKKRKRKPLAKEVLAKGGERHQASAPANKSLGKASQKAMLKSGLIFWQNYQKGLAHGLRLQAELKRHRLKIQEHLKWRQPNQDDIKNIDDDGNDDSALVKLDIIDDKKELAPLSLAERWQMHLRGKGGGRKIRFK